MNPQVHTLSSRKTELLLLLAALLPVVLFVALRLLGLMSLARLGVMALAGMSVGVLLLVRPMYGALFMVVYVYGGLRFYLPGVASVAVMGLTAAALALSVVRGDRFRATDVLFWCSAGIFTLLAMQSMIWAVDFDWWFSSFGRLLKTLLLSVTIVQVIRTPAHLRTFGTWVFIAGVATVCLGVVNLKLGLTPEVNVIGGVNLVRFTGTHDNPNYAAAMMLITLPMGLFFLKHNRKPLALVAGGAGVVVLVVGVFATFSRAAIVAFAAIVLGVLLREVRSRKAGVAVLLLVAGGLLLTPKYYWARAMTVTDISSSMQHDWSIYVRYAALKEAWATFLRHPLTGVGMNNFPVTSASAVFIRIGAHNMYMEMLADLGIFGLVSYVGIQVAAVRHIFGAMRERWPGGEAWIPDFAWYLLLSLGAGLVSGLFADIHVHYMIWIPIALALALGTLRKRNKSGNTA